MHLVVEGGEIDGEGLGQVVHGLDPRVEEEAVELRVLGRDILHELGQVLAVTNVVGEAVGLAAAVLADEAVDAVLAAADGDDFEAFADELFGHAEADA